MSGGTIAISGSTLDSNSARGGAGGGGRTRGPGGGGTSKRSFSASGRGGPGGSGGRGGNAGHVSQSKSGHVIVYANTAGTGGAGGSDGAGAARGTWEQRAAMAARAGDGGAAGGGGVFICERNGQLIAVTYSRTTRRSAATAATEGPVERGDAGETEAAGGWSLPAALRQTRSHTTMAAQEGRCQELSSKARSAPASRVWAEGRQRRRGRKWRHGRTGRKWRRRRRRWSGFRRRNLSRGRARSRR